MRNPKTTIRYSHKTDHHISPLQQLSNMDNRHVHNIMILILILLAPIWASFLLVVGIMVVRFLQHIMTYMPPEHNQKIILEGIYAAKHVAFMFLVWKVFSQMFDVVLESMIMEKGQHLTGIS